MSFEGWRTRFRDAFPPRPGAKPDRGRCIVIGEVAQAHDGSLGFAHAFIDAIAGAGADAVKFQTHIASAETTQRQLVGDLLDRAFGGSARQLVLQALSAKRASRDELAEIRRLLDEFERNAK